MDLPTSIIASTAIIMAGIGIVKYFNRNKKDNPDKKYVLQKVCDTQFGMLNQAIMNGFKDVKGSINELHRRIDKVLEK